MSVLTIWPSLQTIFSPYSGYSRTQSIKTTIFPNNFCTFIIYAYI